MLVDHDFGGLLPPASVDRIATRRALASIIERALALRDALDDDADLEECGDAEPSLGASEAGAHFWSQIGWARGGDGDLEWGGS
jgi:hypothetical protein